MPLPDRYSRRKRLAEKTEAEIFHYDKISIKLTNQILFILAEICNCIYLKTGKKTADHYQSLAYELRKDLGVTYLSTYSPNMRIDFEGWFREREDNDYILDAIEHIDEIALNGINAFGRYDNSQSGKIALLRVEINERMMEDGFGYQLEDGQIIRVDSKFTHKEIVVPALAILSKAKFASANNEFRDAHQFYRDKDFRKAIHQCGNAFESVLKIIADERGWGLDPDKDTASKYLNKVFEEELIPKYLQSEFNGLASVLKDGVATVRNKGGGHGEGKDAAPIPDHIAAFQLHQTAAAILLLADAHDA